MATLRSVGLRLKSIIFTRLIDAAYDGIPQADGNDNSGRVRSDFAPARADEASDIHGLMEEGAATHRFLTTLGARKSMDVLGQNGLNVPGFGISVIKDRSVRRTAPG